MRKRQLLAMSAAVVLTMSMTFTGCGNKAASTEGSAPAAKEQTEEKEEKVDETDVSWVKDALDTFNTSPMQKYDSTVNVTYEDGSTVTIASKEEYDYTNKMMHYVYTYTNEDGSSNTDESYTAKIDGAVYTYSNYTGEGWTRMQLSEDAGVLSDDYKLVSCNDTTTFTYDGEDTVDGVDAIKVKAAYPYDTNALDSYISAYEGGEVAVTEDALRAYDGVGTLVDEAKAATAMEMEYWFSKDDHTLLKGEYVSPSYENISQYCSAAAYPSTEYTFRNFTSQTTSYVYATTIDPITLPTEYTEQ